MQPCFLHLVFLLEADLVVQGAGHKVWRQAVFCYAWLTGLSVQEVIRSAGEPCFFRLVAWCVLRMLEINEGASKNWLGTESGRFGQCWQTKYRSD